MILLPILMSSLAAAQSGSTVLRVNATAFTEESVSRRLEALRAAGRPATPDDAVAELVAEVLLAAEAKRLGLSDSPAVRENVDVQVRRAATQAFVDSFTAGAEPDESALRQLFHSTSDQAWFESLSFATSDEAQRALDRVRAGSSFSKEAAGAVTSRLASKDSSPIIRAEIAPELAAALFGAAPGQTVGPIESGPGWIIARLVRTSVGTEAEFAQRRIELARFARKQATSRARKHVAERLRAQARIVIDEDFLRGLQGADATPAQLESPIATVNGRPIRYGDIHPSVRALGAGAGHMAGPSVKLALATQEVENRLLRDAALERGFDRVPDVASRRGEFERTALAVAAAERIRSAAAPPSEDEIEAYYRRNERRFGRPFREVLPAAARGAAEEKRAGALATRIEALRREASVSIDRKALAAIPGADPAR